MTARTKGLSHRTRCAWAQASPELQRYHDLEYGFPVKHNRAYFERLILELFQAGLSWRTILAKRQAFRRAFAGFSARRVAAFTAQDVQRLIHDASIIRNRLKIRAAIANAANFLRVSRRPGGFKAFLNTLPLQDARATVAQFKKHYVFMGPKIVEEFLMSTGHWPVRHERACFLFSPQPKTRA
jgi:DNA-3-methyladenine glycosylase I